MSDEFIVSTGRIVKEYLDEYKISQRELSARSGISEKHISNVLNGNCRLTEEFALKLEKILVGVPASYWLNYEVKYRENLAREVELAHINQENLEEIAQRFHFNEVFNGLGLTLVEQAIEMLKLLKISDYSNFDDAYKNLIVNFPDDDGEKEAIAVWLNLCESEIEIQNGELTDVKHNEMAFKSNLRNFKILVNNKQGDLSMKECQKWCNKQGIYLVFCEALTNSRVRGALTTYKGQSAIYLNRCLKTHDYIGDEFMYEIECLATHYDKVPSQNMRTELFTG